MQNGAAALLQEVWRERRLLVAHFWHRLLGTAGAWFFWCACCLLRAWGLPGDPVRTVHLWRLVLLCAHVLPAMR